jgi:hypothetical protein
VDLGVPVTKKMEDSRRGCAGSQDRGKEEGARGVSGKREIEVTAGGYGSGTTTIVLSPVNKGWVTPGVSEAGRQERTEDALRP